MYYTVYKIINKVTGKIYIGKHKTTDLNDGYMGSGKLISRAIKKHGVENFEKEYLFIYDNEQDMNNKEKQLVSQQFCLREDTYNLCPGGQGGFGYINQHDLNGTVEGRKRGGETQTARILKELEYRNKCPDFHKKRVEKIYALYGEDGFKTFLGKKHTDETKKKMSEKAKLRQKTKWITNGRENKQLVVDNKLPDGWRFGRTMKPKKGY